MAVTAFQARVLRLLAQSRVAGGETYIAGGLAPNHQLRRPRISHDIDVFNNTYEAMLAAADADRSVLRAAGLNVVVKRERDFIVQSELDMAVVSDEPLDVAMLSRTWHEMIEAARQTIAILPPDQAGKAVLNKDGSLFTGSDAELSAALAAGEVVFHEGRICGAWPQIVG